MSDKKQNRPDSNNRSNRPRRSSVSSVGGGKLSVTGKLEHDKYVYRTVNDIGSRVEELKSYGYDIVQDDSIQYNSGNAIETGSSHSVVVDKTSGQKGVLMRQPKEYHEEDKKLKAEKIADTEKAILRENTEAEGRYGSVENSNSLNASIED